MYDKPANQPMVLIIIFLRLLLLLIFLYFYWWAVCYVSKLKLYRSIEIYTFLFVCTSVFHGVHGDRAGVRVRERERERRNAYENTQWKWEREHVSTYSAHTLTVLGYRVVENNDSNGCNYNGNGSTSTTIYTQTIETQQQKYLMYIKWNCFEMNKNKKIVRKEKTTIAIAMKCQEEKNIEDFILKQ